MRIELLGGTVVPYIGTWIETYFRSREQYLKSVVPYIGTWIETLNIDNFVKAAYCRTLYRYVD